MFKSLINIIERREQQRSNRARRAKDNSRGEENKLQTNLRPREENNLQSQESTNQATTELNNAQIDPREENEEKRSRMDFSNILNSTAIEGGNSLEQFHQMQLPPMTSAASASPSPIREKVKVAQSPEIEFLEAREVECPDCDKKFAARAKLLAHLVSAHYSEKIFKIHPFQKNAPCPLCINSGKQFGGQLNMFLHVSSSNVFHNIVTGRPKAFQIKDRGNHLRHIGQSHEVVLKVVRDEVIDIVDMFSKATRRRSKMRTTDERSQDGSAMMMTEDSRDASLLETSMVKPEPLDMEGVIVPVVNSSMEMDNIGVALVGQEQQVEQPLNVFEELDNMATAAMSLINPIQPPTIQNLPPPPKEPEIFHCEKCELNFKSGDALRDHNVSYEKVHTKEYKCRYCDSISIGTRAFKDHLVSHKSQKKQRMNQSSA